MRGFEKIKGQFAVRSAASELSITHISSFSSYFISILDLATWPHGDAGQVAAFNSHLLSMDFQTSPCRLWLSAGHAPGPQTSHVSWPRAQLSPSADQGVTCGSAALLFLFLGPFWPKDFHLRTG